jgi:SNF2 family DNA or RNA helicase
MPRTVKGGLFCDDMGLGKTLTVIALIMSNDKNNKSLTASAYENLISSEVREKVANEEWGISSGDSEDELNRTVEGMSIKKRKNNNKNKRKNESSDEESEDSYTEDDNTQESDDSDKENICRPVSVRNSNSKGKHPFFAEKSYPKRKKAIIESDSESETLTSEDEICVGKVIASSTDSEELSILEDDDYKPVKTSQKNTKSKKVIFSDSSSDASIKIDRSKKNAKNTKNTGQNKSITSSSNSSPRKRKKIDSDSDDCSITSVSRTNSVTPRVKRKKKSVLRGSQSTNSQPSQPINSQSSTELSEPLITFSLNVLKAAKTMNPEISPSKVQMQPGYHSGLNTTLIVVPLSVISNWEDQVKEHCSKELTVQTFHGESTKQSIISLTQKDIVITTYGTLTSLYDKMLKRGERSIFQIHFLRVILDEAHQIRNSKTLRCDACVGISSERKWFVTGTPMQNRVNDVFTSLRFLQIEPLQHNTFFQEYIGRGFEAEMVDERKQYCAKNVRSLLCYLMMRRNKDDKKPDGKPLVELPLKSIYEFRTNFSPVEDEMYQRLAKLCTKALRESVENDARNIGLLRAVRKNQLHIFAIIRKLRNMCLGIEIVDEATRNALKCYTSEDYNKKMLLESQAKAETEWDRSMNRNKVCSRCEKSMKHCKREEIRYSRTCGHFFCDKCCYIEPKKQPKRLAKEEMGEENMPCEEHPDGSCQEHHHEKTSHDEYAQLDDFDWFCNTCNSVVTIRLDIEKFASSKDDIFDQLEAIQEKALKKKMDKVPLEDLKSSKVKALIGLIEDHFTSENPGKLVVATQSVQFIYLLKRVFREDKTLENRDFYNTFMLHGSMQNSERASVISKFSAPVEEEEGKRVILFLSITCGGVGINLKAANAIIICDPSYNPATEAQCVDRIYRMGQNRPVKVIKLVIRGSIENRMLNIQKQKGANIALAIDDVEEDESDRLGEKMAQLMDLYNVLTTGKDKTDEDYDDMREIYNSVKGNIYHQDEDTNDQGTNDWKTEN